MAYLKVPPGVTSVSVDGAQFDAVDGHIDVGELNGGSLAKLLTEAGCLMATSEDAAAAAQSQTVKETDKANKAAVVKALAEAGVKADGRMSIEALQAKLAEAAQPTE